MAALLAIIVVAGIKLSRYGDIIAEKSGLSRDWMGLPMGADAGLGHSFRARVAARSECVVQQHAAVCRAAYLLPATGAALCALVEPDFQDRTTRHGWVGPVPGLVFGRVCWCGNREMAGADSDGRAAGCMPARMGHDGNAIRCCMSHDVLRL